MLIVKCSGKIRDLKNRIQTYLITDLNGKTVEISPVELKKAIINKKITVVNLKLTSDGRLIDSKANGEFTTQEVGTPMRVNEFENELKSVIKEFMDMTNKTDIKNLSCDKKEDYLNFKVKIPGIFKLNNKDYNVIFSFEYSKDYAKKVEFSIKSDYEPVVLNETKQLIRPLYCYKNIKITRDLMLEFYTAMVEWEAKVMYGSKIV